MKGHRKLDTKCWGQGGRLHAEQGRLPVSSTASRAPQLLSKLWPIHCGPPRRAGGGVTNYRLPTHLVGVWATAAAPAPPATCAASSGRVAGSVARGRRPTPRVPRERQEQPGEPAAGGRARSLSLSPGCWTRWLACFRAAASGELHTHSHTRTRRLIRRVSTMPVISTPH